MPTTTSSSETRCAECGMQTETLRSCPCGPGCEIRVCFICGQQSEKIIRRYITEVTEEVVMTDERETIISKIENLLAKADSSTHEAERDAFYAKAADLMVRHQVEQEELRQAGTIRAEIEQRQFTYSTNDANLPGKRMLLAVAGRIAGDSAFIYYTGSRRHQLATLVGFPDNLDTMQMLYSSFYLQARQEASRRGFTQKRLVTGYMQGFAMGVADKFDEVLRVREAEAPGTGLVLASRRDEIAQAIDDLDAGPARPETLSDSNAAGYGYRDGQNADIGLGQVADSRERTALS